MFCNDVVIEIPRDCRIRMSKRNAYHQAGHAAAIYLGNKHAQLPALHFQIVIKPYEQDRRQIDRFAGIYCNYSKHSVKVEGGRLIQSLPLLLAESSRNLSSTKENPYGKAFEADVINLLAGSVAEAKYVASRDNEVFNAKLINLNALHFYGGSSDLKVISEYMEWFLPNEIDRDQKLDKLFSAAFSFVNKQSNWRAISALAESILVEPNDIISCEKIISLLDSCMEA